MLQFLKKERNKLVSRRVFRVATINQRINVRDTFFRIFSKCNLKDFTKNEISTLMHYLTNKKVKF